MDSCYLCVVGGTVLPSPGHRTASEGFGTCYTCNAHACQIHGDKVQGQTYFRCADCLARLGLITAITVSPPTSGQGAADPVTQRALTFGSTFFAALAPAVTAAATALAAAVDTDAMAAALARLLNVGRGSPGDEINRALTIWRDTDAQRRHAALGFPPDAEDSDNQNVREMRLGVDVIELALLTFRVEAEEWELRSPDDRTAGAVQLAAWALATAYAAREAETLDTSPFELAGGLRLPAIALVLAAAYHDQRSR